MSLNVTGLDIIAVEDENSIGAFAHESSRVSFNDVPKFFNFEKISNINFHASELSNVDTVQVELD